MTKICHLGPVLILLALAPISVIGETINWVGYQYGPPQIPPTSASWFHGDQWFNYNVPDADDTAVFDTSFDPQGNGTPDIVYFGDFTVLPDPPGVPSSIEVPGGDAIVERLHVNRGDFTFRFTDDAGMPQGSLTLSNSLVVGGPESLSLTLVKGQVTAQSASLYSTTGTAKITLNDATLATNTGGLFDIGVLGMRGAVYVGGDSLLRTGYLRVGENGGSNGLLEIVGGQARAEVNGSQIGATGTGRVEIRSGGHMNSSSTVVLANYGESAVGRMLVDGTGSLLEVDQHLAVGDTGTGELEVRDNGEVEINWHLYVGNFGQGTMVIESGGRVHTSLSGLVAYESGSTGEVMVSDPGSFWSTQQLYAGSGGVATIEVSNGGSIHATSLLSVGAASLVDVSANGKLLVGTGEPSAVPSGTLLVAAGGHLSGSGTIAGTVVVDGGAVSPGASPGALKITGNYSQLPGSLLSMEIGGTAPGTEYDQLLVTGNLDLQGLVEVSFINGFLPQVGDTFNLFSAGGVLTPPATLSFLNAPAGFDYTAAVQNGQYSISVTAVPEPASIVLGISVLGLFRCLRRERTDVR